MTSLRPNTGLQLTGLLGETLQGVGRWRVPPWPPGAHVHTLRRPARPATGITSDV